MEPFDEIRETYFEECAELLENLEAGLLALQDGSHDSDTVDAVFRAVHSIKGGAAAFEMGPLVAYAHDFETTLDALRSHRLEPVPAVLSVLLRASDRLGDLVQAARAGETSEVPDTKDLTALLDDVGPEKEGGPSEPFTPVRMTFGPDPAAPAPFANARSDDPSEPDAAGSRVRWVILFEPLPDLLSSGNEPLFLFRSLEVLGALSVTALDDDLPDLQAMDPRVPRLRWRLELTPSAPDLTETEIEAVFEFAIDLCVLEIARMDGGTSCGSASEVRPRNDGPDPDGPGSIAAKGSAAPSPPARQSRTAFGAPQISTTIRVDLTRVDRLVDLVGELVISQSMLAQKMQREGLDQHSEAVSTFEELQQLTRDLQDSVMAIRAQPVKSLFQRMTRIVREAAQATGKQVDLVLHGEDTEIDRTVVERLADPLTHMIRNAIDHGLEGPADRAAAGKAETGTVRLSARQRSDRVVIEVSDDGRGIDRDRVVRKAMERGLLLDGADLDTAEIDRLLFLPGFSTSDAVSALSGRGVGMDVVQRAIRDLNGTISIASTDGFGCTLSVSLPLTLAILDGMIVRSGAQRMVIPMSAIVETQILCSARIERIGSTRRLARFHDRFVPMVDLAESMGFPHVDAGGDPEDAALLFVEPDEGEAFALCVDAIEAQRQVVIKGLGQNFGHVPCVSAATILGDGQVALIVDPVGISAHAGLRGHRPTTTPELAAS